MKKVILAVAVLVVFTAVITNPNQLLHERVIVKDIMKEFNNRYEFNDNEYQIVNTQYFNGYKSEVEQYSNYNNYFLFSTTTDLGKRLSIGFLGSIVSNIDEKTWFKQSDSIMRLHNKVNVKLKQSEKKQSNNWKKKYKISIMRTGYIAKSQNFKPTINFKITRLTKQSNPPYVKVKVVFYDSKNNRSIDTKKSQIQPFYPLNKRFLIIADKGFSNINSKDLVAKIYIDNELTREVKIVKADFHRR